MRRTHLLILIAVVAGACTSELAEPEVPVQDSPTETTLVENGPICWSSPLSGVAGPIEFADVISEAGLIEPLTGMHGHASAFGDVNGDYRPDLLVGTFGDRPAEAYQERGASGPRSDQLLFGGDQYEVSEQLLDELGRSSGAAFADLDGDGDDDLILIRHAGLSGQSSIPSRIYENEEGMLTPVQEPLPNGFLGRTPAIADFDGDGLLDIYVSEDKHGDRGGVLLRNQGGMAFEDVTGGSGLEGAMALGATAGDLNGDSRPDLVTSRHIFINSGDMRFVDVTPASYVEEPMNGEDDPAGVALGDINRDRLVDIVLGQHSRLTVEQDVTEPVRLFLGQGWDDEGIPEFGEVTGDAGLVGLPTLAPHVSIADIDNDGWPDIVTTASADSGNTVAVFRNTGGPEITFEEPGGLGSDQYWVGGPVVDIDQDGRLDVFALEWEPALPSLLLVNSGDTGHWLEVSVDGPGRGVGSIVTVTSVDGDLVGVQEIGVGGGYATGIPPVAHFGLGEAESVDVEIRLPDGDSVTLGRVEADVHIRWPTGCG